MNPRVSVVIPVYADAGFLREAAGSALAQEGCDLEVIVADDGSGIDLPAFLGDLTSRVKLLPLPHRGVSSARNAAIVASRGEVVAFLDADDAWLPGKLKAQLAHLDADPRVGIVFTNLLVVDGDGTESVYGQRHPGIDRRLPGGHFGEALGSRYRFLGRNCVTSTVIVRRSALDAAAPDGRFFDEGLPVMEDMDLWGRLLDHTLSDYLPHPWIRYRRHPGGLHLRHAEYESCVRKMADKASARNASNLPFQREMDRFVADALVRTGLSCLRRADPGLARRILARAMVADRLAWRAYAGWFLSYLPGRRLVLSSGGGGR